MLVMLVSPVDSVWQSVCFASVGVLWFLFVRLSLCCLCWPVYQRVFLYACLKVVCNGIFSYGSLKLSDWSNNLCYDCLAATSEQPCRLECQYSLQAIISWWLPRSLTAQFFLTFFLPCLLNVAKINRHSAHANITTPLGGRGSRGGGGGWRRCLRGIHWFMNHKRRSAKLIF